MVSEMTLAELRRLTAELPPETVLVWAVAPGRYDALPRPRLITVASSDGVWVEREPGAEVLAFDGGGRSLSPAVAPAGDGDGAGPGECGPHEGLIAP